MKVTGATKALEERGWTISRDEVGDRVACYLLPDRIVSAVYGVRKIRNQQSFWMLRSTTTETFRVACSYIDPGHGDLAPLVTSWNDPDLRAEEILTAHVHQLSDEAIAWASDHDLEKALHEYAALPNSSPGARPIWLLGALVILGEVKRLEAFQSSFEAGDHLGFANYVTRDHIDRAVELASRGIKS